MARLRGKSLRLYVGLVLGTTIFTLWLGLNSNEPLEEYQEYKYKTIKKKGRQAGNGTYFCVNTDGCSILEFMPSHPSIARYSGSTPAKPVCSLKRPVTETTGLGLIYYKDRLLQYKEKPGSITCSFQGIKRVSQYPKRYDMDCDRKWKLKNKVILKSQLTIINEDAVLVECSTPEKIVYQNVHHFIQHQRADEMRKRFKKDYGKREDKPDKLSVLIMGTDSVSRGNLKRLMPKTFNYLVNDLRAIDFQGFNKVADNTHPNLVALLMGLTKSELQKHSCQTQKEKSKYDDCPFIWKKFSEKGYATIYGEDLPPMWAFHHDSPGFVEEPTTFYLRPYMQVSDEIIGHNGSSKVLERNVCQGPKLTMSVMHEYSLEIAQKLKDVPYLGLYWITSLTHDVLSAAALADEPSLEYLKNLYKGGFLEHTILFFISDHGLRFGDFRTTYAGMLEEKLPYVTIVFPEWFRIKYSEAIWNMVTNTKRLTSTFDLHATLLDILEHNYAHPHGRAPYLRHGTSLFREIPKDRTCQDAGIPEHFCACENTMDAASDDPNLVNAALSTISKLNEGLSLFPKCVQLSLDKVLTGRLWIARNNTSFGNQGPASTSYVIVFVTKPGGAKFEATVRYTSNKFELPFPVSRINRYGSQSHCIEDTFNKPYCYCKDLL